MLTLHLLSVLWRCWLGVRKSIRPVKNWVVGCWHGYLSAARCRLAYGHSLSLASVKSTIPHWFYFSGTAHLGSPGKRAVKRARVYITVACRRFIRTWNAHQMWLVLVTLFCVFFFMLISGRDTFHEHSFHFPHFFDAVGWVTGRASGL